jgi:hypothetical protein
MREKETKQRKKESENSESTNWEILERERN